MTRLYTLLGLFLFIAAPEAIAQTAGVAVPAQPSFSEVMMKMLPMFAVVFVVFHFMIVRPQKNKEQNHQSLIKGLKTGDSVVTSSGMIGRVAGVAPEHVTLEVATGVKIKFEPVHIVKREGEDKK